MSSSGAEPHLTAADGYSNCGGVRQHVNSLEFIKILH